MNASLNEKLRAVKWGEFKLGDLFEVVSYKIGRGTLILSTRRNRQWH